MGTSLAWRVYPVPVVFPIDCSFPSKGEGLEMVLMSFVSDGSTDHTDTFQVGGYYGGTHAHCGVHGQKYPDKRAMGYPIDRQILDFRMTASVTNFKNTLVYVYHKKSE